MESIDWSAIFELAKKHLPGKGIMRAGKGGVVKKCGGAKKAAVKSTRSVRGGVQRYVCPFHKDYFKTAHSKDEFITHLTNEHGDEMMREFGLTKGQLGAVIDLAYPKLKFRDEDKEATRKSIIDNAFKELSAAAKKVKADIEEKKEEDAKDDKDSRIDELIKEIKDIKGKLPKPPAAKTPKQLQDESWEKEIAKAAKPPAAIPDIMALMKSQQGELPPEQRTDLATMGQQTVKKIKARATRSKATKADKANIDNKIKTIEKTKLKRVPSQKMTVKSKTKGGGKPALIISEE